MGIKKFGFEEIRKKYEGQNVSDAYSEKILRYLQYIGEEMCEHARNITPDRNSGGFDDHTGNLRSSLGYRIYYNGDAMMDGGFKDVGGGNGMDEAKAALDRYELSHSITMDGWAIIIVAGMSYAKWVEAKGFNVLHLTRVKLEEEINNLKKQLRK